MFICIFLAVFVCNLSVNCGKERVHKRAERAEIQQSRCCMREEINKGNFGENTRGMDLTHFSLHFKSSFVSVYPQNLVPKRFVIYLYSSFFCCAYC